MSFEPCKWSTAAWVYAVHADFIRQLNLEDLVDMISETSVFMVVTDIFSLTTLHVLHQEEPLNVKEAGFVMGQIFAALEFLHGNGWIHGNLDPRSIQVMSRNHLWIKLIDTALSGLVDLGKPDGYVHFGVLFLCFVAIFGFQATILGKHLLLLSRYVS